MSQAEDMDAINSFFINAKAVTPEATMVKGAWSPWFSSLGMYDKYWNSDVYNEARSRRNQFNLANTKTEAEKAKVVEVMTTGMTTEEMVGKPKPKIDPKTGTVGATAIKKMEKSLAQATTYPTIRQGNKAAAGTTLGDAIITWQKFLGLKPDGNFGPGTQTATVAWQKSHALTTDGVVGAKTWASAFQAAPAAKDSQPGLLAAIIKPNALPSPASKPAATPEVKQRMTLAIGAAAKGAALNAAKTTAKVQAKAGKPVSKDIANIIAKNTPQPTGKTSAKPAARVPPADPIPNNRSIPSAATSAAITPVKQAGMLSWFTTLPVWAYVAAGVGGLVLVKTGHIQPATFGSPPSKKSKRRR